MGTVESKETYNKNSYENWLNIKEDGDLEVIAFNQQTDLCKTFSSSTFISPKVHKFSHCNSMSNISNWLLSHRQRYNNNVSIVEPILSQSCNNNLPWLKIDFMDFTQNSTWLSQPPNSDVSNIERSSSSHELYSSSTSGSVSLTDWLPKNQLRNVNVVKSLKNPEDSIWLSNHYYQGDDESYNQVDDVSDLLITNNISVSKHDTVANWLLKTSLVTPNSDPETFNFSLDSMGDKHKWLAETSQSEIHSAKDEKKIVTCDETSTECSSIEALEY